MNENTHDPLCTVAITGITFATCDCKYIRRVRADERRLARERVLAAGHTPFGVYDECECPDGVREQDGHIIELMDFYGCAKSRLYDVCRECCTENDYHSENCASDHDHGPGKPYCTAIAAIAAADAAGGGTDG